MTGSHSQVTFDVAVVGLGAVGGAVLHQLAVRGVKAVGLDRFHPPHTFGSSHGETRITRQAIGEGAHYSPFVLRSNRIWEEIEQELSVSLLERCGFIFIARHDAETTHHGRPGFLAATRQAADRYGIAHENLDAAEITKRFPQFTALVGDEEAYYEPGGGYLRVEDCIAAQLKLARLLGATVRTGVQVLQAGPSGSGVRLQTTQGEIFAARAILASGAWLSQLVPPAFGRHLFVTRQVLHWLKLEDARSWSSDASPTYIWTYGPAAGEQFYGFPPINGEVKVAEENEIGPIDPDSVQDEILPEDRRSMAGHVAGRLAGVAALPHRAERCLYTSTPDHDFLVASHPDCANIRVVSACSGHGFKHAAAIGEALATEATGDASPLSLSPFGASRFEFAPSLLG